MKPRVALLVANRHLHRRPDARQQNHIASIQRLKEEIDQIDSRIEFLNLKVEEEEAKVKAILLECGTDAKKQEGKKSEYRSHLLARQRYRKVVEQEYANKLNFETMVSSFESLESTDQHAVSSAFSGNAREESPSIHSWNEKEYVTMMMTWTSGRISPETEESLERFFQTEESPRSRQAAADLTAMFQRLRTHDAAHDEFTSGLPAALLRLFQTTRKQLEDFFPSRYPFRFYKTVDIAVVVSRNRLLLVTGTRLCATVACRLLCLPGQPAIKSPLIHARAIVSRCHFFYEASATCVATLAGHRNWVRSLAFDPTGRFVATGSDDNTAKVWRMSPDGTAATCVATLADHSSSVQSVAFDPTKRFVATGSYDKTIKIWK